MPHLSRWTTCLIKYLVVLSPSTASGAFLSGSLFLTSVRSQAAVPWSRQISRDGSLGEAPRDFWGPSFPPLPEIPAGRIGTSPTPKKSSLWDGQKFNERKFLRNSLQVGSNLESHRPRPFHLPPWFAIHQDVFKLPSWFWLQEGKQSWDMDRDQVLMTSFETLDPARPRATSVS